MKKADVMNVAAIMCAGVFANPASGDILHHQYDRQNLIQQMLWDVQSACSVAGITITDESEAMEAKE